MAARALLSHFGGRRSVPFALYRSGAARGLYLLERDLPPRGPDRDELLARLMGSGHPQQIEGFGGGCGATSKVVVVGPHAKPDSVTCTFVHCNVAEAGVDHSRGDCGHMLGAVAPFALERGLVALAQPPAPTKHVRIHSLNTDAVYGADVQMFESDSGLMVRYHGDLHLPGIPTPAAPVELTTLGIAGSQTGRLLPTGRALDSFDLGSGLGKASVTIVDFAEVLIMFDACEVLPKFGYSSMADASRETVEADICLSAALEHVRVAASLAIGMGNCIGKDTPRVALLGPNDSIDRDHLHRHSGTSCGGTLGCIYFVNPGRCEMHPSTTMAAAQAIGAACLLEGSVARRSLGRVPASDLADSAADGTFSFEIAHPEGLFPVTVGASSVARASAGADGGEQGLYAALFPLGVPHSGLYTTTVLPIAEGRAFI